jgi:type I restriction enzyme S subunit
MKSNYKKIGPYLRLSSDTNTNLKLSRVRGVSNAKQLIKTKAKMQNVDISDYKVVHDKQFVFVPVTSRNGDKLSIALNIGEDILVSKIYPVFEIVDQSVLLPEYLFLWFKRPEFDRYARFHSWGSARETFSWEDICNIEIPFPDVSIQKNIVAVYEELLRNQKSYEASLKDLQLICDTFIEDLSKTCEMEKLGDYIEKITLKNSDEKLQSLVGISEKKEFRTPGGKVNKENLGNHLIVNRNEFAYIPRMNPFKPLAVALSSFDNPVLLSPSYVAFKIKDVKTLLPEFLLLFFKRTEFDRYAAYHAWSSTRDTFNWEDMCEVRLPIPDIAVQESIATIYHVLESRKKINSDLVSNITPLCPVLLKGVVDDFSTASS